MCILFTINPWLLFLTFCLFIFVTTKYHLRKKPLKGPWGFPLLGHLPLLGRTPWRTFLKWKGVYTDWFAICLAGKTAIVVNDLPTMRKIFSRSEANGVMKIDLLQQIFELRGGLGMIQNGSGWAELRTFLVKAMSDYGLKENEVTQEITIECSNMKSDLAQRRSIPVSLRNLFTRYALNANWRAIARDTFTEEETRVLLKGITAIGDCHTIADALAMLFPNFFAKYTCRLSWRYDAAKNMGSTFRKAINNHLQTRKPGSPRDIIDKFQDKVETTTNEDSCFYGPKEQIYSFLIDVLTGSIDTTSITLEWLIMYALKYPNILKNIKDEITNAIGHDCLPEYSDRAKMPYTEACILEALRIRPAVVYGVPRSSEEDIRIDGYIIPKGSILLKNCIGINLDPTIWNDPELFKPERFLTSAGIIDSEVRKKVATFAVGKRQCPGERLANHTLFMMLVCILQNFDLETFDRISFEFANGILAIPSCTVNVAFIPREIK